MTSTTKTEEVGGVVLLRVDRRGRVRVPRERREALLAQYDRSGQSGAAFAEWAGIKYPTFMSWLAERRKEGAKGSSAGGSVAVRWVEAVVDGGGGRAGMSPLGEGGLVIELMGGARIRVFDVAGAGLAAEVLRGLGGVGC